MFPVVAIWASGLIFPGGRGLLAITESPELLSSECKCRMAFITSAVRMCAWMRACLCEGSSNFSCSHDNPYSVETEAAHIGLPSSHTGTRALQVKGVTDPEHKKLCVCVSLPFCGASSLSPCWNGTYKSLVLTLTLL